MFIFAVFPLEKEVEETMRTVRFDLSIAPNAGDIEQLRTFAQLIDINDLEFFSIQDHPYVPQFFDTITSLLYYRYKQKL